MSEEAAERERCEAGLVLLCVLEELADIVAGEDTSLGEELARF